MLGVFKGYFIHNLSSAITPAVFPFAPASVPSWALPQSSLLFSYCSDRGPPLSEQSHISAVSNEKDLVSSPLKNAPCLSLLSAEIPVGKGNVRSIWRLKNSFSCELGWSRICPCILSLHLLHTSWPNFPWEVSLGFLFLKSDAKCLTPVKKTYFDGNAFGWNCSKASALITSDFQPTPDSSLSLQTWYFFKLSSALLPPHAVL